MTSVIESALNHHWPKMKLSGSVHKTTWTLVALYSLQQPRGHTSFKPRQQCLDPISLI